MWDLQPLLNPWQVPTHRMTRNSGMFKCIKIRCLSLLQRQYSYISHIFLPITATKTCGTETLQNSLNSVWKFFIDFFTYVCHTTAKMLCVLHWWNTVLEINGNCIQSCIYILIFKLTVDAFHISPVLFHLCIMSDFFWNHLQPGCCISFQMTAYKMCVLLDYLYTLHLKITYSIKCVYTFIYVQSKHNKQCQIV
jgi:hypothetical protein